MRILNGVSEGLMISGLLGLAGQFIWGVDNLGLWAFGGYCLLWIGATAFPNWVLAAVFNRTPALPSRFPPKIVQNILAIPPGPWPEPRSTVLEACRILKQRTATSNRALGMMVVGLIILAKGMHLSLDSLPEFLPLLQGILGALLGMVYGWWIQNRISQVHNMLS